jgi:hypothetical protein
MGANFLEIHRVGQGWRRYPLGSRVVAPDGIVEQASSAGSQGRWSTARIGLRLS